MGIFGTKYPEEIAKRVPPGQHLVKGWPVLHFGSIPTFDESSWNFRMYGECENPFTLSYRELKDLPNARIEADMHCVTTWTTLDNAWEGITFRTLKEMAKPTADARWVIAHCEHGYTSNLSMDAMDDDDVLVAWANRNEPLAPEHGFPLRLVVPKRYAWKSAKWLRALEFTKHNVRGFWETRGYHIHADPWPEERYSYQEGPRAELEP
jgi:DMSO/TMAO reductase YedYZ molybdopterin-dependent catalytic subunit